MIDTDIVATNIALYDYIIELIYGRKENTDTLNEDNKKTLAKQQLNNLYGTMSQEIK